MQRCCRCLGRKKVYKMGGGYSHIDTGGLHVDCPMCLGEGEVKKLVIETNEIVSNPKQKRIKVQKDAKEENISL